MIPSNERGHLQGVAAVNMSSIVSSSYDDMTITSTSPAEVCDYSIGLEHLEMSNMDAIEVERPMFLVVEPCVLDGIESIATRLEAQAIQEIETPTMNSDV